MKQALFSISLYRPLTVLILLLAGSSLFSVSRAADSTYYFRDYQIHISGNSATGGSVAVFKNNAFRNVHKFESEIESLAFVDFAGDKSVKIAARLYTGGAHCCFSIAIMDIINDSLTVLCTKDLANCDFVIKDLDKDGKQEIVTYDDRFAYEFTSFAESRFYISIYHFENNQLLPQNKSYRDFVYKDIERLKIEFEKLMQDGYTTDRGERASGFAPQAQAILAAIAGNYYSLGEERKGFSLIEKLYFGADKEQFTAYLKMKLSSNNTISYSDFLKLNK